MDEIADWRARIDDIDTRLVKLLNERAHFALEIGRIKQDVGQAIHDPDREAAVLSHLNDKNEGPLDDEAVRKIFQAIMEASRQLEHDQQSGGERQDDAGDQ